MKNAVIYARYSPGSKQNYQSIEGQLKECYAFAERSDLRIVHEYIDEHLTGTNDKRTQFLQMIEDSKRKGFQFVVVYQLDRFARNRYDSATYKAKLKKNGVRVLSAKENITDDASGILIEGVLESMAEYYSAELSQKIKRGMAITASKCKFFGGGIPLGYKVDEEKRFIINEETAPIVKQMFEMLANGYNYAEIARYMNERGIPTSRGGKWNKNSFHSIFANRRYLGKYIFQGNEIDGGMPRIIDDELFDEVQSVLEKYAQAPSRGKALEEYLLSEKAFCGHCGTAMIAGGGTSHTGQKHYYYVCKQKNKALCDKKREDKDKLELYVTQVVQDFLSDRKIVEKAAQDTINYHEQRTGDNGMRSIEAQIRHAQDEAEQLTNAFILARNDLLRANIERKMQEIEILIKDLTAHKAQIELERGQKITKEKIIDFVAMLLKGDPNDKEYQKKLIDHLVYKVFVYDDTVVTYLTFGNDKEIKEIDLADNDKVLSAIKVQSLSPLVQLQGLEPWAH